MMDEGEAISLAEAIEALGWGAVPDVESEDGWVVVVLHPTTDEPQITLHDQHGYELWWHEQVFSHPQRI